MEGFEVSLIKDGNVDQVLDEYIEFRKENDHFYNNFHFNCDAEPDLYPNSSEQEAVVTFSLSFDNVSSDGLILESLEIVEEDFEWTIYVDNYFNVNTNLSELKMNMSNFYQNNNINLPKFLADRVVEIMVIKTIGEE
jgi:hypothetical protein